MILHRLIIHHLKHGDDTEFYWLQALDAVRWLENKGVELAPDTTVLDLGCGHGIFGAALMQRKCKVTFADESHYLMPELANAPFRQINIDKDDIAALGRFDLVICSNVFEHLSRPDQFLGRVAAMLNPNGRLYLSWTNWLSPWGGHEFSPFHYLGVRYGHLVYDKLIGRRRVHTPLENLFPTYVGKTVKMVRQNPSLRLVGMAPRYYPELSFITRLPILREVLTWNCAMLLERVS